MSMDRLKTETRLAVVDVTKVYRQNSSSPIVAVDDCILAIFPGECFGLLGVNGAGKSTLFGIVTGSLDATAGRVLVNGHDVLSHRKQAQKSIGYCPQFDALLDYLTCLETLVLFGGLRGLRVTDSNADHISSLLSALQLTECTHVAVRHLSGGKRRRLSLATALLGAPPLVCLDEPTAGVDPLSRRCIWNLLTACRRAGTTILISSHSMDECEALCTRMGMLVNGRFKCLGSSQHLKSRFGEGYSISLQVGGAKTQNYTPLCDITPNHGCLSCVSSIGSRSTSIATADDATIDEEVDLEAASRDARVQRVVRFFETEFPNIRLLDQHQGVLQFHALYENASLSRIFGLIESYKVDLDITSYHVSQTQLEQVFVSLARQQQDPEAPLDDDNGHWAGKNIKRCFKSVCSPCSRDECNINHCCRRSVGRPISAHDVTADTDALVDDGSLTMLM